MDTTIDRNKLHLYIDTLDSYQIELLLAFITELFDLND